MKGFSEIVKDKRVQKSEAGPDGFNGWLTIRGQVFFFVCSNGGGWDHVSVSHRNRCPSWNEMCIVKDIFFRKDECCIQFHPSEDDYVNIHSNCLHIWKPQGAEIPTPPKMFV